MPLIVCVQCQRHVKVGESVCPFCAADIAQVAPQAVPARRRTSRAAMVLAAVTTAAAAGAVATGCGDDDDDNDDKGEMVQPVYGAPVEDAGTDGGKDTTDAGQAVPVGPEEDAGTALPVYGLAPDER